ncbi:MFS transporter [Actinomadura logoneensis]|uniref:MFS transporter n=1 Tax=Actinomadura logoneensis TaxID=2293572 RepID=A0A372JNV4_9ACTN|nr:MFS transporter [Actinomadura logoneensis]RFU41639.1 MFS transporter [Actinomadura logoneensis]
MRAHSVLPTGAARKPVLLLSLGTFALGTDAFVISGVLPVLGRSLGVGVGEAGQLITIFSGVYALAAPVLAVLTGNWNRRTALFVAMAVFVAANLLAAVATNYPIMVVARVLAALAAALFTPAASAAAASLSAPAERGRALATVLGGLTVANALGVPLGTLIGQTAGWRGTFVFVAALGVIALAGLSMTLHSMPSPGVASFAQRMAVARMPGVPSTLVATALAMVGVFVLYSYLAWFADQAAGVTGSELTVLYLVAGITAVLSNLAAGWMIDHMPPTRVAAVGMAGLLFFTLVLAALGFTGTNTVVLCLALGLWSLIGWLFNPAQQQRLLGASGPTGPIALSLNSSAIYAGQAVAGGVGAFAVAGGAGVLAVVAAVAVALALLSLYVSTRRFASVPEPVETLAARS